MSEIQDVVQTEEQEGQTAQDEKRREKELKSEIKKLQKKNHPNQL